METIFGANVFELLFGGRDRNTGSLTMPEWYTDFQMRNHRKKPLSTEFGEVRYSQWKFIFNEFGGTAGLQLVVKEAKMTPLSSLMF
ncbi:efflux RND transporter periplasmic adaptor subunit [Sesbania bispinosa]|nr:efflux RND transporter periplasmic adaptor subunit [Sesbania bispinosa]